MPLDNTHFKPSSAPIESKHFESNRAQIIERVNKLRTTLTLVHNALPETYVGPKENALEQAARFLQQNAQVDLSATHAADLEHARQAVIQAQANGSLYAEGVDPRRNSVEPPVVTPLTPEVAAAQQAVAEAQPETSQQEYIDFLSTSEPDTDDLKEAA